MIFYRWKIFHLSLLFFIILLIYGHTLSVPFYLDDYSSIVENELIRNFNLWGIFWDVPLRFIPNLSFAIHFFIHDISLAPYHIVNITIHFLASVGIYFFILGIIISLSRNTSYFISQQDFFLPLITALLFACHPLQTQAVTYIVQRIASMAALFYILSLTFYMYYRLSERSYKKQILIILSLLCAVLAFFTKQNTATLPLSILLIEYFFFNNRKRVIYMFFGMFGALIVILSSLYVIPIIQKTLLIYPKLGSDLSHYEYFSTQIIVIWIYIIKFFFPYSINFDYDIEVVKSILEMKVFCALIGHLVLIIAAFRIRKVFSIIAFSIIYYYLTHMIESGLFPITDLCFEHRTYLPNLGICIVLGWSMLRIIHTRLKFGIIFSCCIFVVLSFLTYQRNMEWKYPEVFWKKNIQYTPFKLRPWNELGKHYLSKKQFNDAYEVFIHAFELLSEENSSMKKKMNVPVIANLIIILHHAGKTKEALSMANLILQYPMQKIHRYYILNTIGNIYYEYGYYKQAELWYRRAISIMPNDPLAMIGLANTLKKLLKTSEYIKIKKIIKKLNNDISKDNRLYFKK